MGYRLEYLKKADKDLSKITSKEAKRIITWLDKNINNSENPRQFGKALVGKHKGLWRYRIGKYRVLTQIKDDHLIVLALKIETRGSVYN